MKYEMSKIRSRLIILILCFVAGQSNGQGLFEITTKNPDTILFMPSDPVEAKQALIGVKNVSSDTLLLYWDSYLVMCGEGWDYNICDNNTCYAPFVKSCPEDVPNVFPPGYEHAMRFDILDQGEEGKAIYHFRLWLKGQKEATLDTVVLHFNDCVTAIEPVVNAKAPSIRLRTNPVVENLQIDVSPPLREVKLEGRVFPLSGIWSKELLFEPKSLNRIFVGDLPAGVYFLQLRSREKKINRIIKFIKR